MLILIVGMPSSGKTTAARILGEMGFSVASTGDVIREEIKRRGLPYTKENDRKVADWFHEEGREKIVIDRLLKKVSGEKIVIEGLRDPKQLKELERRLHSVGLLLKRVSILHGSKKIERFIAVIDPRIDLPEIKPYDALTLSVLALIFMRHNEKSKISLSTLREDLVTLIEDKEKTDMILHKALTKLSKDNIIRIKSDEGTIELTEIGKALLPPPDLIDKVIIEALSKKVGEKNET